MAIDRERHHQKYLKFIKHFSNRPYYRLFFSDTLSTFQIKYEEIKQNDNIIHDKIRQNFTILKSL